MVIKSFEMAIEQHWNDTNCDSIELSYEGHNAQFAKKNHNIMEKCKAGPCSSVLKHLVPV
jgi:hypothetical protein